MTCLGRFDHPTLPSTTLNFLCRSFHPNQHLRIAQTLSSILTLCHSRMVHCPMKKRVGVTLAENQYQLCGMCKSRVEGPIWDGLTKARVRGDKSVKGLAELATAALASENEHVAPPDLRPPQRRRG